METRRDSLIINFEKLREEHLARQNLQREKLLWECQQEIRQNEEQIRSLVIQINQLQANIDMNVQLIRHITKQ